MNVLLTILISTVIVLVAVLLLGFKIFFIKQGKFPNIHIGGNKALKEKGIACATTQDRDAQKQENFIDINKIIKQIENK
ncbi:conserved hypothetical protein [uncultured Paludibacter sp.]|uniref:Uncharacterized protein n=1 Tax=uncultured Paludibacter sp. TaxID=497635 RepID=A0A653AFQ4_9BACT|nr:conserved hypothetical protein [uncultured Paludibacter sp.]